MPITYSTYYRADSSRLVAFAPGVGHRGDVWAIQFLRSGVRLRAVQDWPKRSDGGGNGMDLPERAFARGYGHGWQRAGRAEVRYWIVRRVHAKAIARGGGQRVSHAEPVP